MSVLGRRADRKTQKWAIGMLTSGDNAFAHPEFDSNFPRCNVNSDGKTKRFGVVSRGSYTP